jgi:transposase/tetratricopeptide (TPR) repeat protein
LRFRTLETLREYARVQLSPEEHRLLERRAAAYYQVFAERAEALLRGPDQAIGLQELEEERENLAAALEGCRSRREAEPGLRLAAALERFWQMRGAVREGREHLGALLSLAAPSSDDDLRPGVRARACRVAGTLACEQGEYTEARRLLEESLALRRAEGDPTGVADSLHHLGVVALCEGQYATARSFLEESLALWRLQGDAAGIGGALEHLGRVAYVEGDLRSARASFAESLAIRRAMGDRRGIAKALAHMGHVALRQGDRESAFQFYEQRMAIVRELGDRPGIATALDTLGAVALHRGDLDAARALYAEACELHRSLESHSEIAGSLCMLGRIALGQGNLESAQAELEEALGLWRGMGDPRGIAWALRLLGQLALRRDAWREARRLLEESLALCQALRNAEGGAVALEGLARVAAGQGNPVRAVRLYGAAEALRATGPGALAPDEQADLALQLVAVRHTLSEEAFAAAWAEGAALTWPDAAALACEETTPTAASAAGGGKPDAPIDREEGFRYEISDAQWARLQPLMPPPAKEGRPRAADRRTLDGILHVLGTGCRWQDLPRRYGSPATCWRRLARWEEDGTWERLVPALLESLSPEERAAWAAFLLPRRKRCRLRF